MGRNIIDGSGGGTPGWRREWRTNIFFCRTFCTLPTKDDFEKVSKTYANNRARLRRFAEWRDIIIEEITRDMIQAKMLALLVTFTPANVNKHLVTLRAVFNHAINNEIGTLTPNPAARVPFFAENEKAKMIPERDQVAR